MKIKEYITIFGCEDFFENVNEYIKHGYQPFGGPIMTDSHKACGGECEFMQAMVKCEDQNNDSETELDEDSETIDSLDNRLYQVECSLKRLSESYFKNVCETTTESKERKVVDVMTRSSDHEYLVDADIDKYRKLGFQIFAASHG